MDVQWKHFWAAVGYVATCGWATLPVLWDQPVLGAVGTAVTAGGAWLFGRHEIAGNPLFRQWSQSAKHRAVQLLGTASGAHVLWVLAFQQQPASWPGWLAALLAVSGAEVGLSSVLEYYERRDQQQREQAADDIPASSPVEPVPADPGEMEPAAADDEYQKVLRVGRAIFRRAQLAAVEIQQWYPLRGDAGVTFTAEIPDMQSQSNHKKSQVTYLSTGVHGEALAIGARRQLGVPIESSWVQIYKSRQAGMYTVTVLTRDALADAIPYIDTPDERPSIHEPVRIGWRADQQEMTQRIDQCCYEVGKSQSGKSVSINVKLARVTKARDAVQWVCGTSKLYDLVADWIEPYEGTGIEPPINWIAYGPRAMAEMLAAALRVARDRQNQDKAERTGWKAIVVQLDESKVGLNDENAWAKVDGKRRSASSIWAELMITGKSGEVYAHRADQRNVQDSAGTSGGDTTTGTDHTLCFQTNDPAEIGRATGDYKADQPPHAGCFWRKETGGAPPEMGKSEYIQESDASRERKHDGSTIREIAWSRRFCDNELDERAQRAAGAPYLNRLKTVTAEYKRLLKPVTTDDTTASFGPSEAELAEDATPEGGGKEEARAVLASIPGLAGMLSSEYGLEESPNASWEVEQPAGEDGEDASDEPVDEVAGEVVSELDGRTSRSDRIVQILQHAEEPLTRGEVLTRLRDEGDETASEQVVQNALGKLVKAGTAERESGTYIAAELAVAR